MPPCPKSLRIAGLCTFLLLQASPGLLAESAILEATADVSASGGASAKSRDVQGPGVMFVAFKTWNIFRWKVESAELFLHISKGAAPAGVDIAVIPKPWLEGTPPDGSAGYKYVPHKATGEPEGWISIQVDPKLVEEITAGRGHGLAIRLKSAVALNTRESLAFVPYLVVNGGRQ